MLDRTLGPSLNCPTVPAIWDILRELDRHTALPGRVGAISAPGIALTPSRVASVG